MRPTSRSSPTRSKEIDTLTARQKTLMTDEFQARKSYDDFLAAISD